MVIHWWKLEKSRQKYIKNGQKWFIKMKFESQNKWKRVFVEWKMCHLKKSVLFSFPEKFQDAKIENNIIHILIFKDFCLLFY